MMIITRYIMALMKKRLQIVMLIVFVLISVGCENGEPGVGVEATAIVAPSPERMQLWTDSCALCHVTGVGGAPIVGNHDDWADRLEQGNELLLEHTLEGYNNMPPLGYCMACEKDDFVALIEFMAAGTP